MRNGILAAVLLVSACAAAVHGQAGSKAAIEKALIDNENKINEAVAKNDVKTFLSLLAPEAVAGDTGGFMKASDFSKTMGQLKVTSWHIMDTKVVWADDKTAVLMYTWMGAGTYMKQPIRGRCTPRRCGPSAAASGSPCSTRKPPPGDRQGNEGREQEIDLLIS